MGRKLVSRPSSTIYNLSSNVLSDLICNLRILICTKLTSESYCEDLFTCLLAICMSSLKNVYSDLLIIFDWVVCFVFDIELYKLFICFEY